MRTLPGRNKHQKAAHRAGERKISRAQVEELLELACSIDTDERLIAAQYLCPCHVRTRIPEVWDALYRMMEDENRRVRFAAWHTIEDGGMPSDPDALALLEQKLNKETDEKIRRFARQIIGGALRERDQQEWTRQQLAARPARQQRGKCDFCGARGVFVEYDLETLIPIGELPRPALICAACAQR